MSSRCFVGRCVDRDPAGERNRPLVSALLGDYLNRCIRRFCFFCAMQLKLHSLTLTGPGGKFRHSVFKQQWQRAHLPHVGTGHITMTRQLANFDDSTLIELALAGQADCFAVLMDRHKVVVRRRIGSIVRNVTDRDDLFQEILFKVWLRLSSFRAESSFRTWITRVAINEALQACRRERCRPACQPIRDLDAFASSGESPLQFVDRVEVTQAVRRAVVGLPAKYRQVLILHDLEQHTTRETARSLQSTIPAVKTRLHRARLMLRNALRRSGLRACSQ
jgi:RNA polymerase sigma-70 factor, ECF subfamily